MRSSLRRRCVPMPGKGIPPLPSKGIGTKRSAFHTHWTQTMHSLPGVHVVASQLKRWLLGTHRSWLRIARGRASRIGYCTMSGCLSSMNSLSASTAATPASEACFSIACPKMPSPLCLRGFAPRALPPDHNRAKVLRQLPLLTVIAVLENVNELSGSDRYIICFLKSCAGCVEYL
jgi:hypothetical protein